MSPCDVNNDAAKRAGDGVSPVGANWRISPLSYGPNSRNTCLVDTVGDSFVIKGPTSVFLPVSESSWASLQMPGDQTEW